MFLGVSFHPWPVFPESSLPGPGGSHPDCFAVTMTPSGRAIHRRPRLRCDVTSSLKRLPRHIAILDVISGSSFAKKSLKLLPGTGDGGWGKLAVAGAVKPCPVGTDLFEPS